MRTSAWSAWVTRSAAALLLAILCVQMFAQAGDVSAATITSAASTSASCAQLAAMSPSATNGPAWGKTLITGFDAAQGWFGVPVCSNNYNRFLPGGANVSCTQAPSAAGTAGCAPGVATSDGFGLTFQCVELVARFAKWAFGDAPSGWRGDAPYLWLDGSHPADFKGYANGGAVAPSPGDVLVWGTLDTHGHPWPAGPAGGHVAVVENVSATAISFVEENMIGHQNGGTFNIPREQTTLTRTANGGWLIGPTFGENGGRALYGWLHSSRNTGQFPHTSAVPAPSSSASTPTTPGPSSTATTPPGLAPKASTFTPTPHVALPSLSQGVVITGSGALAQVVWSDSLSPLHTAQVSVVDAANVRVVAESLGAPDGVTFPPNQAPAILSLPTGERYVFARGNDSALYSVYTAPSRPEPYWQSLGAPAGVKLTSSPSAVWDQAGMAVGALGSDGAYWLRAGPSGALGDWVSLGVPDHTAFIGTPALADSPQASPSPAVTRLVLALGHDGALYEADWSAPELGASASTVGQAPGWTKWTKAPVDALPSPLVGGLRLVTEPSTSGAALDAIGADASGHLWILRRTSQEQPWTARSAPLPSVDMTVVGAALLTQTTSTSAQGSGRGSTPADLTIYVARPASTATAAHIEEATISLGGAAISAQWRPFDSEITSASQPTALALGAYGAALLTTSDTAVTLLGANKLVSILQPSAKMSATPSGMDVGQLPEPGSFSDSFASGSVDPRWMIRSSAQTPAVESEGALTLLAPQSTPSSTGIAQAVPSGSFTVTTHVIPGVGWSATAAHPTRSSAEAGIRLALNDWNAVSLGLTSTGTITFCPEVEGASLPCSNVAAFTDGAAVSGAYLRISVAGSLCTGEVSRDGRSWTTVGTWNPSWLTIRASEIIGPYSPLLAAPNAAATSSAAHPQPFTSVRLYVARGALSSASPASQPDTGATSARFSDFTISGVK